MKRFLLGLGSSVSVVAPLVMVVSCNDETSTNAKRYKTINDLPDAIKLLYTNRHMTSTSTIISNNAFAGATLPVGFIIPEQFNEIGNGAFKGATFQGDFTLTSSIKKVNDSAFENDIFTHKFLFQEGLEEIKTSAFKSVTFIDGTSLPYSVKKIDQEAFKGTTLPSSFITLPNRVELGLNAFAGAKLPIGFIIPSSTTYIKSSPTDFGPFKTSILNRGYVWRDSTGTNYDPRPGDIVVKEQPLTNITFTSGTINISTNELPTQTSGNLIGDNIAGIIGDKILSSHVIDDWTTITHVNITLTNQTITLNTAITVASNDKTSFVDAIKIKRWA